MSEYLPGLAPSAFRFPARNRLISALSDVTIVVEAKRKSGSLITADFALEQGKEIYAVPGRLDDAVSAGCNELIRQGAGIVTSTDELLEELGFEIKPDQEQHKNKETPSGYPSMCKEQHKNREISKITLEKAELMVYSCFDLHAKNMEELVQMTKISPNELADLLIKLEAKGWIEEFYKNHYRKK